MQSLTPATYLIYFQMGSASTPWSDVGADFVQNNISPTPWMDLVADPGVPAVTAGATVMNIMDLICALP